MNYFKISKKFIRKVNYTLNFILNFFKKILNFKIKLIKKHFNFNSIFNGKILVIDLSPGIGLSLGGPK